MKRFKQYQKDINKEIKKEIKKEKQKKEDKKNNIKKIEDDNHVKLSSKILFDESDKESIKSNKTIKSLNSEKSRKSAKSEKSITSNKSTKSKRSIKSEKSTKSKKSNKSGKSNKSKTSIKSNRSTKSKQSNKSKKSTKSKKSNKSGKSSKSGKSKTSRKSTKNENNKIQNLPEYINARTKDFIIIRPEDYSKISQGEYICFTNKDGFLKPGGYVWFAKRAKKTNKMYFVIGKFKNVDFSKYNFRIYWDNIETLWKRKTVEAELLIKSIDAKQYYISDIAKFLKIKYGQEFEDYMNEMESLRKLPKKEDNNEISDL